MEQYTSIVHCMSKEAMDMLLSGKYKLLNDCKYVYVVKEIAHNTELYLTLVLTKMEIGMYVDIRIWINKSQSRFQSKTIAKACRLKHKKLNKNEYQYDLIQKEFEMISQLYQLNLLF